MKTKREPRWLLTYSVKTYLGDYEELSYMHDSYEEAERFAKGELQTTCVEIFGPIYVKIPA